MRHRILVVAALVGLFLFAFQAIPVRAHEPFDVGPYHIEVGWMNEPPVTWQQNAVEVIVTNGTSGAGIVGLATILTITLNYGGQSKTFSGAAGQIRTTDANGTYHAPVVLTQPGSYDAVIQVTIGTTAINVHATPDAFERVVDGYLGGSSGPMFPVINPSPSPIALQSSINDANNRAMLMGWAGIGLGIAGIGVGVIALLLNRRKPKTQ
jgi:hypothetical protein